VAGDIHVCSGVLGERPPLRVEPIARNCGEGLPRRRVEREDREPFGEDVGEVLEPVLGGAYGAGGRWERGGRSSAAPSCEQRAATEVARAFARLLATN
jgi:hypothetical protein